MRLDWVGWGHGATIDGIEVAPGGVAHPRPCAGRLAFSALARVHGSEPARRRVAIELCARSSGSTLPNEDVLEPSVTAITQPPLKEPACSRVLCNQGPAVLPNPRAIMSEQPR